MQSFFPFQRPLRDLQVSDLTVLKDVSEGWYVEYKRECGGTRVAAKSLSSFANSYGGWLFYGIEESTDGQHRAGKFTGILREHVEEVVKWLQQGSSIHVSPSPYYEHRVLYGPDDTLQLPEGRGIIVVHIPMGNNAPYLHSTGRFYRRVADASDPVHETDRHFLDLLWQRGKSQRDRFKERISGAVPGSYGPSDVMQPRITLFFFPDPWGEQAINSRISFEEFASVMRAPDMELPGVPFDNIQSSSKGFIARQRKNSHPGGPTLEWEYGYDCSSRITVPLSYFAIPGLSVSDLGGYESVRPFFKHCYEKNLSELPILDLSHAFLLLTAVTYQLRSLLAGDSFPGDQTLYFKARITGCSRKLVFLDLSVFMQFIEEYGVPMVPEDDCFAPAGTTPNTCLSLGTPRETEPPFDSQARALIDAAVIMLHLLRSFGLPSSAIGAVESEPEVPDTSHWATNLHMMGERARQVMQNRMKRSL